MGITLANDSVEEVRELSRIDGEILRLRDQQGKILDWKAEITAEHVMLREGVAYMHGLNLGCHSRWCECFDSD